MSKKSRAARRLRKSLLHRQAPPGSPPGTLVADPASPRPILHVVGFGPEGFRESEGRDPAVVAPFLGKWPVLWVHVEGLGDASVVGEIGRLFGLHPLALEDVLHVHQRAKVEVYEKNLYVVVRPLLLNERLETEQWSFFLGEGFVVSFQEKPGPGPDDIVRERIRTARGRICAEGADYLLYSLLDAVLDGCFPVLERFGDRLDELEVKLLEGPNAALANQIHEAKRDIQTARRAVWPVRDALSLLVREGSPFLTSAIRPYLRDCYDHAIQLMDVVETYREIAVGMTDLYLSGLSNRMNEVMKVLTIIATLFIPLSFIASLYGMNFDPEASPFNMPELKWRWGYPFVLGLMSLTALGLLAYFRWKGWMGGDRRG